MNAEEILVLGSYSVCVMCFLLQGLWCWGRGRGRGRGKGHRTNRQGRRGMVGGRVIGVLHGGLWTGQSHRGCSEERDRWFRRKDGSDLRVEKGFTFDSLQSISSLPYPKRKIKDRTLLLVYYYPV